MSDTKCPTCGAPTVAVTSPPIVDGIARAGTTYHLQYRYAPSDTEREAAAFRWIEKNLGDLIRDVGGSEEWMVFAHGREVATGDTTLEAVEAAMRSSPLPTPTERTK